MNILQILQGVPLYDVWWGMAQMTTGASQTKRKCEILQEALLNTDRLIKEMKRTLLGTCLSHKIDHAQCSKEEILVRMQPCLRHSKAISRRGRQLISQTMLCFSGELLCGSSWTIIILMSSPWEFSAVMTAKCYSAAKHTYAEMTACCTI